ncbi:peptidase M15 [Bacillus nakamurai]|uniref:Peptidase M15 n=1 Tax=Bacillus nakamurai TaxID=1793963 RepID=A0A150FDN1_9BACI|nr:M15 family metallopeptidase [Bacillus nakamurai]KXZ20736.1 peptidase M15 [Bacillus nakamurai]KXZ23389.1 peptidase M15 [Bacillus nakamurai]MCC9022930.1 M15 family metallopeptidase [Bacillus nakamurai]MED1226486.1 M15 family metallopeptidase [Bacillus nakamurai]
MRLPVKIALLLMLFFSADLCYSYVQKELRPQTVLKERDVPAALHPLVKQNAEILQTAAAKKGITVVITEGFRSIEEQNELYRQGRSKKGNIVTYAKGGESYHNYGLAIDFALQKKDGSLLWDMTCDGNHNGTPDWLEVVTIAKKLGFQWGGDWRGFKDYPHLQMIPS